METVDIKLTAMANGGDALGRDEKGRVIFVPFTIPGEEVRVEILEDRERFAHAYPLEWFEASPERIEPRCPHFGMCGGCQWQHISYPAQMIYKQKIVRDQLARIGHLQDVNVRPTWPHPTPWVYGTDVTFSPTADGRLGFWSPFRQEVMPIEVCHIIHPRLLDLFKDIDLALPGLRRLTLRLGDDEAMLVALETEGVEAPQLATDFPVSVAMVLPDGTAANLVGDNYVVKAVKRRDFRVSAGSFFYPNPEATAYLVDTVLRYASQAEKHVVVDAYCGVGTLAAFLAEQAEMIAGIENMPDAVTDAAVNLDATDNVTLYEGAVADVLPALEVKPDLLVVDPPAGGLARPVVEAIVELSPPDLIYVSADIATLARDGRQLHEGGYHPAEVQPLDMLPQTFHVHTVSHWTRK